MRAEIEAIRFGVALHRADHVVGIRISGPEAFEVVDALSPRPLYIRDGQMLPAIVLNDDGTVFADLMICADDLDWLLFLEGPSPSDALARLLPFAEGLDATCAIEPHVMWQLHGPYAWECLADLIGPEVVGIPYLTHFLLDPLSRGICFRSGKTGEFGYELWVPPDEEDPVLKALRGAAGRFDAVEVGLEALDLCALETGFYSIRHPAVQGLSVPELQLLWRVELDRDVPGMEAVRAARHPAQRLTWVRSERPFPGGLRSPLLEAWIGLRLVDRERAWPGVDLGDAVTTHPPLLWNRSLHIDAQKHSWASRELDDLPDVRP